MEHFFSKTVLFKKSFICEERQTDKQTDRQTDKHPQPCDENKPFGILRKDCLAAKKHHTYGKGNQFFFNGMSHHATFLHI